MVGKSDIEEVEIDVDSPINVEDVDEASNLSEQPRKLRGRPASVRREGTERKTKRLLEKERSEFLSNFDQSQSEREKRKLNKKHTNKKGKAVVYDERGILMSVKKDLCDCMEDTCPGCHFPCPKCRSNKCGHECRQNRKWVFNCVELDGIPGSLVENPYAKDFQVAATSGKK